MLSGRDWKIFWPVFLLLLALAGGCEFDNEISGPDDSGLKIIPASVFLEADETNIVEFTAVGGQYAFTWAQSSNALGSLYFTSTNTAVVLYYSTTNTGTNVLTVLDAANKSAAARIVQR